MTAVAQLIWEESSYRFAYTVESKTFPGWEYHAPRAKRGDSGEEIRVIKANLSDLKSTVPPLHHNMVSNVVFPDAKYGRVGLSILQPGGGAEMHLHRGSEHYYLMIEGKLRVRNRDSEIVVGPGEAVLIEDEEPHQVSNAHEGITRYFSVTSPPPKGWEPA